MVVTVVEPNTADHPFVAALAGDGLESAVVRVGAKGYLKEWRSLRRLMRQVQPDIVHTHGYRSDVIGGLAAASVRIPRVTTVHGFTGGGAKNRANEWLQIRSYYAFSAVVAVSQSIVQRLRNAGVPDRLIRTIPNAIDPRITGAPRDATRARIGALADEFVIGWVGRMSSEKGLDVLIEALPNLKQPFKCVFIGDGPDRSQLSGLITKLGLDSSVRWTGAVPDAASLFSAFDVFVLSSRTEGIPIVLLEAMRANVPIVATQVGGVPEMLDETEALLVPSEQPAALAKAIESVREDAPSAARRAQAARARLERDFAVEPWVRRYEAVYRSVLPDAGAPAK
jgi:glycosyltransferase involved in cell wall biosynthesis